MDRQELVQTFTNDVITQVHIDVNNPKNKRKILELINNNDDKLDSLLQWMFRKNTWIADNNPALKFIHQLVPTIAIPDLNRNELNWVVQVLQTTFANEIASLLRK